MTDLRPIIPEKDYFNIGEACRIVGLPPYTLRYWESRFGMLRPMRKEGGHRRYTRRNLETILRLKTLVGDRRMTFAGARKTLLREMRPTTAGGPETMSGGGVSAAAAKAFGEIRKDLREILAELSK